MSEEVEKGFSVFNRVFSNVGWEYILAVSKNINKSTGFPYENETIFTSLLSQTVDM